MGQMPLCRSCPNFEKKGKGKNGIFGICKLLPRGANYVQGKMEICPVPGEDFCDACEKETRCRDCPWQPRWTRSANEYWALQEVL